VAVLLLIALTLSAGSRVTDGLIALYEFADGYDGYGRPIETRANPRPLETSGFRIHKDYPSPNSDPGNEVDDGSPLLEPAMGGLEIHGVVRYSTKTPYAGLDFEPVNDLRYSPGGSKYDSALNQLPQTIPNHIKLFQTLTDAERASKTDSELSEFLPNGAWSRVQTKYTLKQFEYLTMVEPLGRTNFKSPHFVNASYGSTIYNQASDPSERASSGFTIDMKIHNVPSLEALNSLLGLPPPEYDPIESDSDPDHGKIFFIGNAGRVPNLSPNDPTGAWFNSSAPRLLSLRTAKDKLFLCWISKRSPDKCKTVYNQLVAEMGSISFPMDTMHLTIVFDKLHAQGPGTPFILFYVDGMIYDGIGGFDWINSEYLDFLLDRLYFGPAPGWHPEWTTPGSHAWAGSISSLAIYRRALTDDEVQNNVASPPRLRPIEVHSVVIRLLEQQAVETLSQGDELTAYNQRRHISVVPLRRRHVLLRSMAPRFCGDPRHSIASVAAQGTSTVWVFSLASISAVKLTYSVKNLLAEDEEIPAVNAWAARGILADSTSKVDKGSALDWENPYNSGSYYLKNSVVRLTSIQVVNQTTGGEVVGIDWKTCLQLEFRNAISGPSGVELLAPDEWADLTDIRLEQSYLVINATETEFRATSLGSYKDCREVAIWIDFRAKLATAAEFSLPGRVQIVVQDGLRPMVTPSRVTQEPSSFEDDGPLLVSEVVRAGDLVILSPLEGRNANPDTWSVNATIESTTSTAEALLEAGTPEELADLIIAQLHPVEVTRLQLDTTEGKAALVAQIAAYPSLNAEENRATAVLYPLVKVKPICRSASAEYGIECVSWTGATLNANQVQLRSRLSGSVLATHGPGTIIASSTIAFAAGSAPVGASLPFQLPPGEPFPSDVADILVKSRNPSGQRLVKSPYSSTDGHIDPIPTTTSNLVAFKYERKEPFGFQPLDPPPPFVDIVTFKYSITNEFGIKSATAKRALLVQHWIQPLSTEIALMEAGAIAVNDSFSPLDGAETSAKSPLLLDTPAVSVIGIGRASRVQITLPSVPIHSPSEPVPSRGYPGASPSAPSKLFTLIVEQLPAVSMGMLFLSTRGNAQTDLGVLQGLLDILSPNSAASAEAKLQAQATWNALNASSVTSGSLTSVLTGASSSLRKVSASDLPYLIPWYATSNEQSLTDHFANGGTSVSPELLFVPAIGYESMVTNPYDQNSQIRYRLFDNEWALAGPSIGTQTLVTIPKSQSVAIQLTNKLKPVTTGNAATSDQQSQRSFAARFAALSHRPSDQSSHTMPLETTWSLETTTGAPVTLDSIFAVYSQDEQGWYNPQLELTVTCHSCVIMSFRFRNKTSVPNIVTLKTSTGQVQITARSIAALRQMMNVTELLTSLPSDGIDASIQLKETSLMGTTTATQAFTVTARSMSAFTSTSSTNFIVSLIIYILTPIVTLLVGYFVITRMCKYFCKLRDKKAPAEAPATAATTSQIESTGNSSKAEMNQVTRLVFALTRCGLSIEEIHNYLQVLEETSKRGLTEPVAPEQALIVLASQCVDPQQWQAAMREAELGTTNHGGEIEDSDSESSGDEDEDNSTYQHWSETNQVITEETIYRSRGDPSYDPRNVVEGQRSMRIPNTPSRNSSTIGSYRSLERSSMNSRGHGPMHSLTLGHHAMPLTFEDEPELSVSIQGPSYYNSPSLRSLDRLAPRFEGEASVLRSSSSFSLDGPRSVASLTIPDSPVSTRAPSLTRGHAGQRAENEVKHAPASYTAGTNKEESTTTDPKLSTVEQITVQVLEEDEKPCCCVWYIDEPDPEQVELEKQRKKALKEKKKAEKEAAKAKERVKELQEIQDGKRKEEGGVLQRFCSTQGACGIPRCFCRVICGITCLPVRLVRWIWRKALKPCCRCIYTGCKCCVIKGLCCLCIRVRPRRKPTETVPKLKTITTQGFQSPITPTTSSGAASTKVPEVSEAASQSKAPSTPRTAASIESLAAAVHAARSFHVSPRKKSIERDADRDSYASFAYGSAQQQSNSSFRSGDTRSPTRSHRPIAKHGRSASYAGSPLGASRSFRGNLPPLREHEPSPDMTDDLDGLSNGSNSFVQFAHTPKTARHRRQLSQSFYTPQPHHRRNQSSVGPVRSLISDFEAEQVASQVDHTLSRSPMQNDLMLNGEDELEDALRAGGMTMQNLIPLIVASTTSAVLSAMPSAHYLAQPQTQRTDSALEGDVCPPALSPSPSVATTVVLPSPSPLAETGKTELGESGFGQQTPRSPKARDAAPVVPPRPGRPVLAEKSPNKLEEAGLVRVHFDSSKQAPQDPATNADKSEVRRSGIKPPDNPELQSEIQSHASSPPRPQVYNLRNLRPGAQTSKRSGMLHANIIPASDALLAAPQPPTASQPRAVERTSSHIEIFPIRPASGDMPVSRSSSDLSHHNALQEPNFKSDESRNPTRRASLPAPPPPTSPLPKTPALPLPSPPQSPAAVAPLPRTAPAPKGMELELASWSQNSSSSSLSGPEPSSSSISAAPSHMIASSPLTPAESISYPPRMSLPTPTRHHSQQLPPPTSTAGEARPPPVPPPLPPNFATTSFSEGSTPCPPPLPLPPVPVPVPVLGLSPEPSTQTATQAETQLPHESSVHAALATHEAAQSMASSSHGHVPESAAGSRHAEAVTSGGNPSSTATSTPRRKPPPKRVT